MKAGDKVTWMSQSQGVEKEKSGTIIMEIPAGHSAMTYVPSDTKKSHIKFQNISSKDRVLVAVPAGKDEQNIHYYCPYKSILTIQTNEDFKRLHEEKATISKALSLLENLNKKTLSYDKAVKIVEILSEE